MFRWITDIFSKKKIKDLPDMSYLYNPYYKEVEHLRFELRRAEGGIAYLTKQLNQANDILCKEKLGIYKYIETTEERFQKKRDLATFNIQHRSFLAAKKIYKYAGLPESDDFVQEYKEFGDYWDKRFDWKPKDPYKRIDNE